MKYLILRFIRFYQRFLSPLKGYGCAYRIHTGHPSCSALGFRAIRRFGVLRGFVVLRQRLFLCGVAFRRYSSPPRRPPAAQRGDCDIPCDIPCDAHCDMPSGKQCSFLSDLASCADCGSCDPFDNKKKKRNEEQYVYIPPNLSDTRKKERL